MGQALQHYVGRIVRLNADLFHALKRQAIRKGYVLENSFLVAAVVKNNVKKLICYGANFRVEVSVGDVVLV